ncbi:MAG: DNA cytosine methyltransferase [Myxococcota bacterium]
MSPAAAAKEIGVTVSSLKRHLQGSYVRSDSLAKYRTWLDGQPQPSPSPGGSVASRILGAAPQDPFVLPQTAFKKPLRVVDIFSGAGGFSVGLESVGGGAAFKTVLAIERDEAFQALFNANHETRPCRAADIEDFKDEYEIRAFYLDHVAENERNDIAALALSQSQPLSITAFKGVLANLDKEFRGALDALTSSVEYREAVSAARDAMSQTSVQAFLGSMGLPIHRTRTITRWLWADALEGNSGENDDAVWRMPEVADRVAAARRRLRREWNNALQAITMRGGGEEGPGQLGSSAGRIGKFVDFAGSPQFEQVMEIWLHWASRRDGIRQAMFENPYTRARIDEVYSGELRVGVLVGGPPCQGFSRIGRGKIGSLKKYAVHAHHDARAGDVRNKLLGQYVLFVKALLPQAILFENVRHFEAAVVAERGTFSGAEALFEELNGFDHGGGYVLAGANLQCANHGVPQTRERFFLVGVQGKADALRGHPSFALQLPELLPVPLLSALQGLEQLPDDGSTASSERRLVPAATAPNTFISSADHYRRWLAEPPPPGLGGCKAGYTDAHWIRTPRPDDAALFAKMGPGTRWMDYRSDESPTAKRIAEVLRLLAGSIRHLQLRGASEGQRSLRKLLGLKASEIRSLAEAADGSLGIRLLLEGIEPRPGETEHHLLADAYLAKKEGNHGDWLVRLAADKPCRTIVSHMGRDTYAYVHPFQARTLSVREAARVQTFPDWYALSAVGLVDAFRAVGNAVPPFIAFQIGARLAQLLAESTDTQLAAEQAQLKSPSATISVQ